jgi:hypothetical protein
LKDFMAAGKFLVNQREATSPAGARQVSITKNGRAAAGVLSGVYRISLRRRQGLNCAEIFCRADVKKQTNRDTGRPKIALLLPCIRTNLNAR